MRQHHGTLFDVSTQALRLVGVVLVLAILVSMVFVGRLARESRAPGLSPALTPAEQAQLEELEARPLHLLAMPADSGCPILPTTDIHPFRPGSVAAQVYMGFAALGSGPVYRGRGYQTDTAQGTYLIDVPFFTDPSVRGPVLIRGGQLDGRFSTSFFGPNAAGRVVGTESIPGKNMTRPASRELHGEAVLLAGHWPPPDPNLPAAPGWGIWKVGMGFDIGATGCHGLQIDTMATSEVLSDGQVYRSINSQTR
ncbi:MAG TPA: hypothetical protein VK131_02305 [Candidatus Acidoferrales bacterium]|nr:hypothetical protein [Candidatus Acidoferrales bacterium]